MANAFLDQLRAGANGAFDDIEDEDLISGYYASVPEVNQQVDYESFRESVQQQYDSSTLERVGDFAVDVVKAVPTTLEAVAGLAGLVPGVHHAADPIGKAAKGVSKWLGDNLYSDERLVEEEEISRRLQAVANGEFGEQAKEALSAYWDNPAALVGVIGQSIGLAKGGAKLGTAVLGGLGKPVRAADGTVNAARAAIAGQVGEGMIAGGLVASSAAQESPDDFASRYYAIPTMGGTMLASRFANKLMPDTVDVDTAMAGGLTSALVQNTGRRAVEVPKAILKEGVEETLQEGNEQVFGNLATDKPWDESLGSAMAVGAMAGAGMGGGMAAVNPGEVSPPLVPDRGPLSRTVNNAAQSGTLPPPVSDLEIDGVPVEQASQTEDKAPNEAPAAQTVRRVDGNPYTTEEQATKSPQRKRLATTHQVAPAPDGGFELVPIQETADETTGDRPAGGLATGDRGRGDDTGLGPFGADDLGPGVGGTGGVGPGSDTATPGSEPTGQPTLPGTDQQGAAQAGDAPGTPVLDQQGGGVPGTAQTLADNATGETAGVGRGQDAGAVGEQNSAQQEVQAAEAAPTQQVTSYKPYTQRYQEETVQELIDQGASPEAAAKIASGRRFSLPIDSTTGMIQGQRAYDDTQSVGDHVIGTAIEHAGATNEPSFLVSADIANLGGLNAHMGNDQKKANTHYRAMTDIVLEAFREAGLYVEGVRTGGDEFAVVIMGGDASTLEAATEVARARLAEYGTANEFNDVPHPKHLDDPTKNGIGIHLGYTQLDGGMTVDQARREADATMNLSKKGASNVGREQTQAGGEVLRDERPEGDRAEGTRDAEGTRGADSPTQLQEVTSQAGTRTPAQAAQAQNIPDNTDLSVPIEYDTRARGKKISPEVDGEPVEVSALPYIRDLDARLNKLAKVVRCLG